MNRSSVSGCIIHGTFSERGTAINRETRELIVARARLWRLCVATALLLLVGTIGYWAIRREGPLDALQYTLSALAYLNKTDTNSAGWALQVVLLHGGTIITWYIGWMVVDLLMDNHFGRYRKESKRMTIVKQLSGHVVVCGGGRVGTHVAELLAKRGDEFVIVESDADRVEALKERDYLVVEGDAKDEAVLRTAGVDRASTLVCALSATESNVMIVLTARGLSDKLEIHARCDREDYAPQLSRAGATKVILPARATAEQMVGTK